MDIIARLQLNAAQFSSEAGRAAADVTGKMGRAAADIRAPFAAAFAEVNKLAQSALTIPRSATGAIDLSGEIAQLNVRAAAVEQNSIALRELSIAQMAAANSAGVDSEALRREADASAVASVAAEREADAIRDRVIALKAVQGELDRATSSTVRHGDATEVAARKTGAMRFAMQGLSYQAQDTFTQLSMGANAFQVLAIQGGQAAGAFANVEGKAGDVGRFLIGPWGLAITAGLLVLGPLVSKLWESGNAAEESAKRLTQAATAADSFGSAQSLLGKVIDLTTGKLKTQNAVLIQTIRLQAQVAILNAQNEAKKNTAALAKLGAPGATGLGALYGGFGEVEAGAAEAQRASDATAPLRQVLKDFSTIANNPTASPKMFATAVDDAVKAVDKLAASGAVAKKNVTDVKLSLLALATNRQDQIANQQVLDVLNGGPIPDTLKPYAKDKKPPKGPKPTDYTRADNSAEEQIARINAEWGKQPSLVAKAGVETLKLDNLIEQLQKRKLTPEVEKLIAAAKASYSVIQEGMNRPFQDFVEGQRQSVAVQQLILAGHDAEASALQSAIRISQQQSPLDEEHLATILRTAEQQERISNALEDQRRVVGLYVGTVHNLQNTFDRFLDDLYSRPGDALKNIGTGIINDFRRLQNAMISEQLFGGVDRAIEDYIRKAGGKQTPAEILSEQASAAGLALKVGVDGNVTELGRLTKAFGSAATVFGGASGIGAPAANDNNSAADPADIVVTANRQAESAAKMVRTTDVWNQISGRLIDNLDNLGIHLPASIAEGLKTALPGALQGASIFSQIGSSFGPNGSGIGGGIGAALGAAFPKAMEAFGAAFPVYQLSQAIAQPIGKMLGLDSTAVSIGGIGGGLLAKLLGVGAPKWSNASVTLDPYGQVYGGTGAGKGGQAIAAATGTASSVASGINAIADQLGARIMSLPAMTLGTWDGRYRVADLATNKPLHSNNFGNDVLHDFGSDQQAAIEYAVRYSISHAVVDGISQASQTILKSGQDLQTAISKALLIEAVPKDLKAMLDPVGAAVDALNLKFQHTVDALKEGGATTEQMAQAEQLYNLQLQQTIASTAAASQTLKDFQKSLMLGSNSPYSLRDQETTALAALKPFLDQINAGQAIDQSKYQAAAQAYLDVERQMYGSTSQYFDVLDLIQAATSKAISTIDNVAAIGTPVESPFAQATATAAQATAANTQAAAEIGAQTNDLLQRLIDLMDYRIANDAGFSNDRGFVLKTG